MKIVCMLLCLVMLLSMAACSSKEPAPTGTEPESTPANVQIHDGAYNPPEEIPTETVPEGTTANVPTSGNTYLPEQEPDEKPKETVPVSTSAPVQSNGGAYNPPAEIPAETEHQHSFTCVTVAPTTASMGYDQFTCTGCGYSYCDNYTEKLVENVKNVLWIDDLCTVTQTSGFEPDFGGQCFEMTIENKSNYELTFNIGKDVFIDNELILDSAHLGGDFDPSFSVFYHQDVTLSAGETLSGTCVIPAVVSESKLDISLTIHYSNKQSGVFHESGVAVDTIIPVHDVAAEISNPTLTGNELIVFETDSYKLAVVDAGSNSDSLSSKYFANLYLENTSSEFVTFLFDDFATATSEKKTDPFFLGSSGVYYLDHHREDITLAPGTYCYLVASFSGDEIDRQAQDIHDVVTVTIPVGVQVGTGDRADYSLRITRDQFVG